MKRYEIYSVNLEPTIGIEMKKTRPCLIISPDEMNRNVQTVIVAPLTTRYRNIPSRIKLEAESTNGLSSASYVSLDQIKTIDKVRCGNVIGYISNADAMKTLGYVNQFGRGIEMVQEELEANKNGLPKFKFDDITTFKVIVMNTDPKTDGTENGAENGAKTLQKPYKNLTRTLQEPNL